MQDESSLLKVAAVYLMPRATITRLLCWLTTYPTVFPAMHRHGGGLGELSAITGHMRLCWCCMRFTEVGGMGVLRLTDTVVFQQCLNPSSLL